MTFQSDILRESAQFVTVVHDPDEIARHVDTFAEYHAELKDSYPMAFDSEKAVSMAQDAVKHNMGRVLACYDEEKRTIRAWLFMMYDDWHSKEIFASVIGVYVRPAYRKEKLLQHLLAVAEALATADGAIYFQTECPNFTKRGGKMYKNFLAKNGYEFFPKAIKRLV